MKPKLKCWQLRSLRRAVDSFSGSEVLLALTVILFSLFRFTKQEKNKKHSNTFAAGEIIGPEPNSCSLNLVGYWNKKSRLFLMS